MHQNFVFNNITDALPGLTAAVLKGDEQGSRNGRTRERCHVGITLAQPWQREIVLSERKANIAAQIAETMWVLTGRDDIGWLRQYLPRAEDFSDDGERWRGAYGPRLRAWQSSPTEVPVDQWEHVLSTLKADPLSRRTTISIYDPVTDTEPGLDIPCNNWLVFTNRLGYLDLQVGIRSNDLMWGWSGINAFEWSALLEISAQILGVKVGSLHFSIASLHLYEQHWTKAKRIANEYPVVFTENGMHDSPRYAPGVQSLQEWDALADQWMSIEAMIRERSALAADNLVLDFPEPMLKSWLRVIQWWWSGDHQYLKDLGGTRLEYATHVAMQPPARGQHLHRPVEQPDGSARACCETIGVSAGEMAVAASALVGAVAPQASYEITEEGSALLHATPTDRFVAEVTHLHDQKHAAYGHSWKKRGEMRGIMANIARKVDRLGGSATDDETSADTAADLMVYLFKYAAWLFDQPNGTSHSDGTEWVNNRIADTARRASFMVTSRADLEERLRTMFDELEQRVIHQDRTRTALVDQMGALALLLALHLWETEQDADDYRGADVD